MLQTDRQTDEHPVLSVITICRCNPDELEETLISFGGLDSTLVETIVVDGSPDDSCCIVAERNRNLIAKYVHEPDHGRSDAMNKGVNLACGDGVICINSGDRLWSAEDFNHIAEHNASAFGDTVFYGDNVIQIAGSCILRRARPVVPDDVRTGDLPSHQATIIPRGFCAAHPYDEGFDIAFDTKVMRVAFDELDAVNLGQPIAVFANGGISTVPGNWHSVFRHFSEMVLTRDLSAKEEAWLLLRLIRRKALLSVLGRSGLQRLQRQKQRRTGVELPTARLEPEPAERIG